MDHGIIETSREVPAIQIPDGITTTLEKGARVYVHQSLGGSYTLSTEDGALMRISTADADAIGKEPEVIDIQPESSSTQDVEKAIWEVLRTVFDPEIPVNIVDLGLIYHCKLEQVEPAKHNVKIEMTLTAPGCGMGPVLQADVESRVKAINTVVKTEVEVVFDPPWDKDMMTEAAQLELGML